MDPTSLAAGAAAGAVIGDIYEKAKDQAKGIAGVDMPDHGPIELHMLVDLLADIHKIIKEAAATTTPSMYKTVQISNTVAYEFNRNGYKHVSILASAAFTVTAYTVIGPVNFALGIGWNAFDIPDKTVLYLQSVGTVNVVFRWGEDSLDIPGV